jgi:hypothetical protein
MSDDGAYICRGHGGRGAHETTFSVGLSYDLRVGTSPGADDVFCGMADNVTGQRQVPALGNAQQNRSRPLVGLLPGTYYWSVQAVDTVWEGSSWATDVSFVVVPQPGDCDGDGDVDLDDYCSVGGPSPPYSGRWRARPSGNRHAERVVNTDVPRAGRRKTDTRIKPRMSAFLPCRSCGHHGFVSARAQSAE